MRRPVGRDFLATHSPDLFGVALEENPEEPAPKLIADPILEIARVAHGEESRFQPGKNAKDRLQDAELDEGFKRLERVSEKFAAVKYPRRTWAIQHVVGQELCPQVLDRLRFGEKAMPADIEVESFIGGGARNSPDINRVGLEHDNIDIVLRKQVGGCQSGRSCSDYRDSCFHLVNS